MLAPFIICLREGIEIFLVIIPRVVYFNKNKLYGMTKSALLGGALGTFIATIVGSIIFSQVVLLDGPAGCGILYAKFIFNWTWCILLW
ncbi:FTR1 family protein [Clostridium estertheticum]|uniref:FTR1 family protein n=1 Tax=Clostridium estertheticum TaxID=238834 RepID=UPI00217EBC2A|nr:FTR1 family protein [Clostridium estertheticum]